jgi:hypothetical protein
MSKIQLDLPDDIHLALRQEQLRIEVEEKRKLSLKDLCVELIKNGVIKKPSK